MTIRASQYVDSFVRDGYAVLDLSLSLRSWLPDALASAQELYTTANASDSWFNHGNFQPPEFPRVPLLEEVLNQLLWATAYPAQTCQLSSLSIGYGLEKSNRHVDGAYRGLHWSGLLMGVALVSIPEDKDVGQLLVWPRTHRTTQARFDTLGADPTEDAVRKAIDAHGTAGVPVKVSGPAGSVILMDHRT